MAFSDLIFAADAIVNSVIGDLSITFHFKDHTPDLTVVMASKNPAMEEDYAPGSQQGSTVIIVWRHFLANEHRPVIGDTATVNGIDYDVWQVDTDRENATSCRLRRRAQRFDQ